MSHLGKARGPSDAKTRAQFNVLPEYLAACVTQGGGVDGDVSVRKYMEDSGFLEKDHRRRLHATSSSTRRDVIRKYQDSDHEYGISGLELF